MDQEPHPDSGTIFADPKHVRGDCQLAERFGIPEKLRPSVAIKMMQIVHDPQSTKREQTAAARVLVMLDRLNMDSEDRVLGRTDTSPAPVHVSVTQTTNVAAVAASSAASPQPASPADVARELIAHAPDYLDDLRQRAIRRNGYAVAVGGDVQPGTLENVPPHGDGGPLPDGSGGRPDQAVDGA